MNSVDEFFKLLALAVFRRFLIVSAISSSKSVTCATDHPVPSLDFRFSGHKTGPLSDRIGVIAALLYGPNGYFSSIRTLRTLIIQSYLFHVLIVGNGLSLRCFQGCGYSFQLGWGHPVAVVSWCLSFYYQLQVLVFGSGDVGGDYLRRIM